MAGGSYGEAEIAKWCGAVFYWLLSGCKNRLDTQLIEKYDYRNAWTGYVLFLLLLSGIFYLIIVISGK